MYKSKPTDYYPNAVEKICPIKFGFSLTDLVENYYKPEKSRKTNRRRGQSNKTDNKIVEINNPILKSLLKWTHAFSEKFSKINITHSYLSDYTC